MKKELGTDHYVHLRIINQLIKSKKYSIKDVFTKDEKYSFYPFLLHWLIAKYGSIIEAKDDYKNVSITIVTLRVLFFNVFIITLNFTNNFISILLMNVVYLTFPFSYLKWNAINTGLSARGFGLLIGEVYLYFLYSHIALQLPFLFFIMVVLGSIFFLSSQFAMQFYVISSVFFAIYFLEIKWVFLPLLSVVLFFVFNNKLAKTFFIGQYNHKRNYVRFYLKDQFKHRMSFYRDFIYDFWINFFQNYKNGIKYFMTNPLIESLYGFIYLAPVIFFYFHNNIDIIGAVILSGIFGFIATSFRLTRFLGEAQRYIQFVCPFIVIAFVKQYPYTIVIYSITIALILIFLYFIFYNRVFSKEPISYDKLLKSINGVTNETDVIISNDIQFLKVISATNEIISSDLSYNYKNLEEFQFYFPNSYSVLSVSALGLFNKRHKAEVLIVNEKMYSKEDLDFLHNIFSLKIVLKLQHYKMYQIINSN